jgi:hypothetical protein
MPLLNQRFMMLVELCQNRQSVPAYYYAVKRLGSNRYDVQKFDLRRNGSDNYWSFRNLLPEF